MRRSSKIWKSTTIVCLTLTCFLGICPRVRASAGLSSDEVSQLENQERQANVCLDISSGEEEKGTSGLEVLGILFLVILGIAVLASANADEEEEYR